jgi:hypothetical protein
VTTYIIYDIKSNKHVVHKNNNTRKKKVHRHYKKIFPVYVLEEVAYNYRGELLY